MYYFTVNYSTIYYSTTTPAVCISETHLRRFTVHLLFYYFTILLFYYFTILPLFQYCTILLCTILLLTIPLLTILPRPQPFASRKPTCAGSRFTYYFTILLFYYSSTVQSRLHLGNRPAPVHGSLTILLFYYFTMIPVLYYSTMYYFTVNYSTIYYSTTTPAVCISETDLRRFTVHLLSYYFTILLLFQYCTILCTIFLLTIPLFTILLRPQPFASRKPTCAGSRFTYYLTILLFYYSSTVQSRLHLGNRPAPVHGSLTILLFYYFTIIPVLYYSTMYYFTVNYSTIDYSTTTPAVCISETDLHRFTVHLLFYYFTIPVLYKAVCISETDLRRFTVHLLFYYYSSTVLFYYVLFYCYIFHYLLFYSPVLYYSTMYYFTVNYSTIYYSTTTPAMQGRGQFRANLCVESPCVEAAFLGSF